ncbi:MAG: insulinase family protein, partial [Gammaproteobacteria bacterium]|nr:insulinase family protein [Gammaproteobacteria bacterium]
FSDIPRSPKPVVLPDISEPRQENEKRASRNDPLAPRPGYAFAYHVPQRLTPEWYAMGLIDQVLLQGEDSWLTQEFVKEQGITSGISGGINAFLGNMLNYKGPMIWQAYFIHDADVREERITGVLDGVIERLRSETIDTATLDRAKVKWRSAFYNDVSSTFGFGRADLLASLALYDDDPTSINRFEAEIMKVTPDLVRRTAEEYLRPGNRTILVLEAGAAQDNAEVAAND